VNGNLIDTLFARLRAAGRKAFIPFLTAGDPNMDGSVRLAKALVGAGASLVEIGFPYSDPIADGPVIQASYTRALARGVKLDDIFALARRLADSAEFTTCRVPLVAMTSFSLVHRRGPERFLSQAAAAGFSGAIIPDLPVDESEALSRLAGERDFKLIHLVTPTTPPERAAVIARRSTGFLYCVSVTGITGERDSLPGDVVEQLTLLRRQTDLPLCVGFGVSRPEHVRALRGVADGVIVGSALVRKLEQGGQRPFDAIVAEVAGLAAELAAALNPV
jgi:tryptophan synthase alpha chain